MLRALFALSEGHQPPVELIRDARQSRDDFLRRSCVAFVVVDKGRAPNGLQGLAVDMLALTEVYSDAGWALFAPVNPPGCDKRSRTQADSGRQ